MKKESALELAAAIFAVVALVHLARVFLSWKMVIGSFNVPVYFSYIGFAAAGFLALVMHASSK